MGNASAKAKKWPDLAIWSLWAVVHVAGAYWVLTLPK